MLYFDGNLPDKITATIHTTTTLYLHRDFQTPLAALYAGQKVELIGMAPEGYLLTANVRNNTTTGWIKPKDLPRASTRPSSSPRRKTRRGATPSPWPSPTRTSSRA